MIHGWLALFTILLTFANCSYRDVLETYLGRGSGVNHAVLVYFVGFVFNNSSFRTWDPKFEEQTPQQEVQNVSKEICRLILLSLACKESPFNGVILSQCSETTYANVSGYMLASTKIHFSMESLVLTGLFKDLILFEELLRNTTIMCGSSLRKTPMYLTGTIHATFSSSDVFQPTTKISLVSQDAATTPHLPRLSLPIAEVDITKQFGINYSYLGFAEGFVLTSGRFMIWNDSVTTNSSELHKRAVNVTLEGIMNGLLCNESILRNMSMVFCQQPLFGSVNGWIYSTCWFNFSNTIVFAGDLSQLQMLIDKARRNCSKYRDDNYKLGQVFVTFESTFETDGKMKP